MFDRPTTLSERRQNEVEKAVNDLWIRVLDATDRLLDDVPDPLREHLFTVAFESNDALPKRDQRPKIETAFLCEQLLRSYDPDAERLDALLEFTLAVEEYYDIADDVVDGDVTDGGFESVFLASQLLVPLFVRRLPRLGAGAVEFWADRATDLVAAPFAEHASEPTLSAYLSVVDRQSNLIGFVTGLAAVAAAVDEAVVRRAERIGRHYYVYEQFLLDREQYAVDDDPWNLWRLAPAADARELLEARREALDSAVTSVPEPQAEMIRALYAQDLDAWLASFDDGPN